MASTEEVAAVGSPQGCRREQRSQSQEVCKTGACWVIRCTVQAPVFTGVVSVPRRKTVSSKFDLIKWETESLNRNKVVSESQPLTNTLARFMYNTYRVHTCKYLINWRNYTKRDLSLKWPNLGSFYILKLIFLCAQLEKASRALVSRSF